MPSSPIWRRCAKANGSSTASARSLDPRPCWPICRAIPTASPSPTAASSRPTPRASPSRSRITGSRDPAGYKTMTLATDEFIRRFLIHVLPKASTASATMACSPAAGRADNIARARQLLDVPKPQSNPTDVDTTDESPTPAHPCPCCGGRMIIIETFEPRLLTPLSSRAAEPRDQDRHVMMTTVPPQRPTAVHVSTGLRPVTPTLAQTPQLGPLAFVDLRRSMAETTTGTNLAAASKMLTALRTRRLTSGTQPTVVKSP